MTNIEALNTANYISQDIIDGTFWCIYNDKIFNDSIDPVISWTSITAAAVLVSKSEIRTYEIAALPNNETEICIFFLSRIIPIITPQSFYE